MHTLISYQCIPSHFARSCFTSPFSGVPCAFSAPPPPNSPVATLILNAIVNTCPGCVAPTPLRKSTLFSHAAAHHTALHCTAACHAVANWMLFLALMPRSLTSQAGTVRGGWTFDRRLPQAAPHQLLHARVHRICPFPHQHCRADGRQPPAEHSGCRERAARGGQGWRPRGPGQQHARGLQPARPDDRNLSTSSGLTPADPLPAQAESTYTDGRTCPAAFPVAETHIKQ